MQIMDFDGGGKNVARFWSDPGMSEMTLMEARFTSHGYPTHFHDGYVVAVTETGGAEVKGCGVGGQAAPGTILVFNPGDSHSGWMGRSDIWSYRSFYIEREAIQRLAAGLGVYELTHFPDYAIRDQALIRDLLDLHRMTETNSDSFEKNERSCEVFGSLFGTYTERSSMPARITADKAIFGKAAGYIAENYFEPISLDALSDITGVSKFRLIKIFRKVAGMTPHQYLIQCRVNCAYRLLKHGVEINQAAISAGFYDQSALNRYFKRCYAVTPGQFAARR
jgi:AraC-like DNA-binding protein